MSFKAADPNTILARTQITGVANGQILVGLDFRPATGELFALGYGAASQAGQLYKLNLTTAVATPVGAGPVALPLGDAKARVGFDFDPTTDLVRVCSNTTQANVLLSPTTGSLAATNANLTYAAGDAYAGNTPGVGTIAYTNSYSGSRATTLYAVDEQASRLVTAAAPAAGEVRSVAALYIIEGEYPPSVNVDLDFYYDPATGTNVGYFSNSGYDAASGWATFSTLDPATGISNNRSWIGPEGGRYEVRDLAVQPAGVVTATRPAELAASLTLAPNPLVGSTQLCFSLPRAAHAELTVTDALGHTVDAGLLPAGPQAIRWSRQHQPAGSYFFSLRLDGQPAATRQGIITE